MTTNELIEKLNLKAVTEISEDKTVTGCYIGDLLSWVMSRAQAGDVWITVMTNINIAAVGALTDVACIIIPENIEVEATTVAKANKQEILILSSSETAYQLACKIHDLNVAI